jgi:hypothetical protein
MVARGIAPCPVVVSPPKQGTMTCYRMNQSDVIGWAAKKTRAAGTSSSKASVGVYRFRPAITCDATRPIESASL